jgi:hypothetical protein
LRNRRRFNDLRRGRAIRSPKQRILIVCEGEKTEPEYFEGFRHAFRQPTVEIRAVGLGVDPSRLVAYAIGEQRKALREARRASDAFLKWDQVWCVFDVDRHAHWQTAIDNAATAGIAVAVSNPCFELWALLHFMDQRAHLSTEEARRLLRKWMPGYSKELLIKSMFPGYGDAVRRAQELLKMHQQNGAELGNPSTAVYRLTEAIRALASS